MAINMTPTEIRLQGLHRVVPERKYAKGPRPTIKGEEARSCPGSKVESKWTYRTLEQTEEEKRKMEAMTLEIILRNSFKLHIYSFGTTKMSLF